MRKSHMPSYKSADDALIAICQLLLRDGRNVAPRGLPTLELAPFAFVLENPRARRIGVPARRWNEALAVGELCWHLSASDDARFISYYAREWSRFSENGIIEGSCYGKKIFGPSHATGGRSQWDLVKSELRRDPKSRRAVLTTLDAPSELTPTSKDVACLTSVQFLLRSGKLDCIATMRSNDVIWGLCYDLYLITMLQELLAWDLGAQLGAYTHVAGSMHVYDRFVPMAEKIASTRSGTAAAAMPPMVDVPAKQAFLEVEHALRMNLGDCSKKMAALPPYWRALTEPLWQLHEKRHQESHAILTG